MESLSNSPLNAKVVDLYTVRPVDLDDLWQQETRFWRDQLCWDVIDTYAALRRLVERAALPGKAVQVDARTVGYAYYGVAGPLGVICGLTVAPEWNRAEVGELLINHTIATIRQHGVSRIESPFISSPCPWLAAAFEQAGFRTYWREFLRLDLRRAAAPVSPPSMMALETWRDTHLREAALLMQAAYSTGIEPEVHAQYCSVDGCRGVLQNILDQGSCGSLVADASALVRYRKLGIGFILVTEVARRQGHLTHIVVAPEYQRRGLGRMLLDASVAQLTARQFETLSLIVSRDNEPALSLYQALGFQPILSFPVFIWKR